jgi:hypothetical protein
MQLDSLTVHEQLLKAKQPNYEMVKLPPDITVLSSEQLAEMFTVLTGWADYIATQLANAQIQERTLEKKLDRKVASLLVEKMGAKEKGDRVTLVKAQISMDEEVQDIEDRHHQAYVQRKAWEVMLQNQERDTTLVSREITRRTSDQRSFRKDYGTP